MLREEFTCGLLVKWSPKETRPNGEGEVWSHVSLAKWERTVGQVIAAVILALPSLSSSPWFMKRCQ